MPSLRPEPHPEITVIIPTRLDAARAGTLARAIRSIRAQRGVTARILIAANGAPFDANLRAHLAAQPGLRWLELPAPGVAGALRAARAVVDTPFFSFLDDDDEYLPGALAARIKPLQENAALDVVVGNGLRIDAGTLGPSGRRQPIDALTELLTHNWLTSCSAVYRSARIGDEFFSHLPAYCEWTYLAFHLCIKRRVGFIDAPGHLIHDTPGSLSKSSRYSLGNANTLARVLTLDLPPAIRQGVRACYGRALHHLAEQLRLDQQLPAAWRAHGASLVQPGGLRFLSYTRHLIGSALGAGASRPTICNTKRSAPAGLPDAHHSANKHTV